MLYSVYTMGRLRIIYKGAILLSAVSNVIEIAEPLGSTILNFMLVV